MSEQLLLQGKLLGIEEFLGSGALPRRSQWITLLSEVLPRALLAELGLARILLGSSGGGQFMLLMPGEQRGSAEEFLARAAEDIAGRSQGCLRLLWSVTENLGDWSVVRKRLTDELQRKRNTPLAGRPAAFEPFSPELADDDFPDFHDATSVGWSPPALITPGPGRRTWNLTSNLSTDGITVARHAAPADDGRGPADPRTLAGRAQGRAVWGMLRGDVDGIAVRLRRLNTIEEHVQVSVLYKQFFAGELEVLCSLPDFWRKVAILYSGGDDFAVYGAWDALLLLARELERVFHRFTEENLKDFPGAEAKTITMALALSPDPERPLASVFEEAGRNLEIAKSADKDCMHVMGRILEWKQLSDAAELKEAIARTMSELHPPRQFLARLRAFYEKESSEARPWRFQRRYHRVLTAKSGARLRPAGVVALEWARLAAGE